MIPTTPNLDWIVNYIWGIADDVLGDVYGRSKRRDHILPPTVPRRLDPVLESTKQVVVDLNAVLDGAEIVEQDPAFRQAAKLVSNGTSQFSCSCSRPPARSSPAYACAAMAAAC